MGESGVFMVGDTYDAQCECGWEATGFEEDQSADEVLRLHLGDDHCPDCGAVVTTLDRVCEACEEAADSGGDDA